MATVDFTLDDIREVIDTRFKMFEKGYDENMRAIQQDFLRIYERFDFIDERFDRMDARMDNFDIRLNSVETHFASVNEHLTSVKHNTRQSSKLLAQHSKDIMGLRARAV